ncbi:VolA/Pla-1 family phospholipase [Paraglaciecola aestuariivivens]
MKKSLLSVGVLTLFGLSGCIGEDGKPLLPAQEVPEEVVLEAPYARVVFNPGSGDLNVPNDFLMIPSGNFFDFTLNTEQSAEFDASNPQHVLSALDGWSAHMPFQIRVELPEGLDIDASSVSPSSIRIFESTQALEGDSATCLALADAIGAPGVPCELGDELQFGVDFVASYTPGSGAITVVPLKPMKSSQGHMLVVTEDLKSTDGRAVKGSITWELARQNINTNPLGSPDLLQLQGLVNSLVNVLAPTGLTTSNVSYAAYFSTQSTGDALETVKTLNVAPYAQAFAQTLAAGADMATAVGTAKQFLPSVTTQEPSTASNVFEAYAALLLSAEELAQLAAVGLDTCDGLVAAVSDPDSSLHATASATFAVAGPYCAATIVEGEVQLPYYSSTTAPTTDWWRAACTSGATLKALGAEVVGQLIQGGQVGPNNDLCQLASEGQLFDLDLSSLGMADPRNITKFNPIPMRQGRNADDSNTLYNEAGTETVKVQFTVPNESVIALISAATGGAVPAQTKPESGWPTVLFQHGAGQTRENASLVAASLAMAGFASAAIDHPLHGERAITLDDGTEVNATLTGGTDYFNLLSLLTYRDNARQSIADILAFRLSLNAIMDSTGKVDLDASNVHFMGQSLGAMYGTSAATLANQSLGGDLAAFDSMYAFKSAVLNVPTVTVIPSLLESPAVGATIKGKLLSATSPDFVAFLTAFAAENGMSAEAAVGPAFTAFTQVISAEQLAELNATFAAFTFAAQTAVDAPDPISYAADTAANVPTLLQLVVGGGTNADGSVALSDQVNPVVTSLPLAGGQALANLIGLSQVSSTTQGSGLVRFNAGAHESMLSPAASPETTKEMQTQAATFVATNGENIVISNTAVVEN